MAPYAEQVIVCTGQDDWSSKIEDENSGDNLANDVKELIGRGGVFADPYNNISLLNSSFPSSPFPRSDVQNTSAYILPSFKYVPYLPRVSFGSVEALVKGFLLPKKLHPAHDGLSPIHKDRLTRKEEAQSVLQGVKDVEDLLVLICGHGGRDMRCGLFGPVLREEFSTALKRADFNLLTGPVEVASTSSEDTKLLSGKASKDKTAARVGLISHIGGHKYAGNLILYIPPGMKLKDGKDNPLAGCGIWYGRVEPKHVEGIIKETIQGGMVIEELFRGGVRKGGEVLRL